MLYFFIKVYSFNTTISLSFKFVSEHKLILNYIFCNNKNVEAY